MAGINLRSSIDKKKLREQLHKEDTGGNGGGGSDFLPYYKLKDKESLVIRFLPDANPDNQDFFIHEETVFKIGQKTMKWAGDIKDCPSMKLSKKYYDQEDKENGLKYYKKRKWFANCFLVSAPEKFLTDANIKMDDMSARTRIISIPKSVFETIKDTAMDEDFDDFDLYNFTDEALNFKMTVSVNSGGYNEYKLSKFELKPKPLELEDEDYDAIGERLKDLSKIYKASTAQEFEDAIEIEESGGADEDEKPSKQKATEDEGDKPVKKKVVVEETDDEEEEKPKAKKKVVEEEEDVEEEAGVTPDGSRGKSILDSIRAKRATA